MKKWISIIAAVALGCLVVCGLCACGSKPSKEESAGLPSPVTEYGSLEEVNTAIGSALTHPGVAGVSDESFAIIDCGDYQIGQYLFAVNDNKFCLRASSNVDIDISGYYLDGKTMFVEGSHEDINVNANGILGARWFNTFGQYTLTLDEGSMDAEAFADAVFELEALTDPSSAG